METEPTPANRRRIVHMEMPSLYWGIDATKRVGRAWVWLGTCLRYIFSSTHVCAIRLLGSLFPGPELAATAAILQSAAMYGYIYPVHARMGIRTDER